MRNHTRTAQKQQRRRQHRLSHEIKPVRQMTNRRFRRKGRALLRLAEEPTTPSSKEYKTGGWISW